MGRTAVTIKERRATEMIKRIDHFVITVADIEKTGRFYAALGFRVRNRGDFFELLGDGFKINVHLKGRELSPRALNVQTGSADFCFEVKGDLRLAVGSLEELGYLPELKYVERTGSLGTMTSCYFRDPDGNLVELSSYEEVNTDT